MLFIHVYVVATIKKNETRSSMTRSKNRSQAVGKHHSKLQNIGVWHDKKGEIQRIRRETKVIQYRTECPQISPPSKRQTPLRSHTTPYPVHTGVHAQAVELRFYQRQGLIFEVESQDRSVTCRVPGAARQSAFPPNSCCHPACCIFSLLFSCFKS